MAKGKWVRGGRGKGMVSALWQFKGKATVETRTLSLLRLLGVIVFAGGTRGIADDRADNGPVPFGSGVLYQ